MRGYRKVRSVPLQGDPRRAHGLATASAVGGNAGFLTGARSGMKRSPMTRTKREVILKEGWAIRAHAGQGSSRGSIES